MGRRVTSTTKGGKFMNPTDQARKQARKKELRKNKKQREIVRQAVIKTKDPRQMFLELDQLDEMELNPRGEQPYNEKVIKEKRRKLLDNIERIINFYTKDDKTYSKDLRNLLNNYNRDRMKKEVYYESVKNAQQVKIDSIPLPDDPFSTVNLDEIPLPGAIISKPASILRKKSAYEKKKNPPGPPPGPPPLKKKFKGNIPGQQQQQPLYPHPTERQYEQEYARPPRPMDEEDAGGNKRRYSEHDDDSDEEFQHRDEEGENAGITPLQAMMLKLAGQNPANAAQSSKEDEDDSSQWKDEEHDKVPGPPPGLPPAMASKQMAPPGPPAGRPPTLPPGPPPGLPPSMPHVAEQSRTSQMRVHSNVFSAPPSLISRPQQIQQTEVAPTIVAKPKLTNTNKVDVTRFMPTSLRVNRQVKGKKVDKSKPTSIGQIRPQKQGQNVRTADAAYDSFMAEMQGLL